MLGAAFTGCWSEEGLGGMLLPITGVKHAESFTDDVLDAPRTL